MTALLEVSGLCVRYHTPHGWIHAVEDLSFSIHRGEVYALVGESGCGKTTVALALLNVLPANAVVAGGTMRLADTSLASLDENGWRRVRGGRIGMIFQDPALTLNPVQTIGAQIQEVIEAHRDLHGGAARQAALQLLQRVAMPDPEVRLRSYPHELSGGMRQRAMIAVALAGGPEVLIADEPTTALDPTIQAQILHLVRDLCRNMGLGVLWITHDFGVVAEVADRVGVMYAGRKVEEAPVDRLFSAPMHPYTRALMNAVPRFPPDDHELRPIPGHVPVPVGLHPGCPYLERCPEADRRCARAFPPEISQEMTRVACWVFVEPDENPGED